jgi:hypothetical protein
MSADSRDGNQTGEASGGGGADLRELLSRYTDAPPEHREIRAGLFASQVIKDIGVPFIKDPVLPGNAIAVLNGHGETVFSVLLGELDDQR